MIDYTLFNSDKSLMRTTTDMIPGTYQAFKDSQIPYGITVKPFGDLPTVSNSKFNFISFIFSSIFRAKMFLLSPSKMIQL